MQAQIIRFFKFVKLEYFSNQTIIMVIRHNFLFLCFVVFFSNSSYILAQDSRFIDLSSNNIDQPSIEYFVLDIFDNREDKSSIGITSSENNQEITKLYFTAGFHEELNNYFKKAFPAAEGKMPVFLIIHKLWITEITKEGISYSNCELVIEFQTPEKQWFYQCNYIGEKRLDGNQDAHKENLISSLNNCLQNLKDPEMKKAYYAVLNKNSLEGLENKKIQSTPKARIAFQFGYTHRTKSVPEGVNQNTKDYYKKLKNTFNIGSDINFFVNENSSLGFSGSFSQAKSTLPDVVDIDSSGNIIAQGDLNTIDNLFYIGPSYFNRSSSSSSNRYLLIGLTMGYYRYSQNLDWLEETVKVTGGTIGFGFSLGVDFLTSERFAAGLQASILMGWIKDVKMDGVLIELAERENLTRIDITIGFRFLP